MSKSDSCRAAQEDACPEAIGSIQAIWLKLAGMALSLRSAHFHGHVTPDLALVLSKAAPWGSQKETALTFGKRRQGPSEYGLSEIRSSAGMVA